MKIRSLPYLVTLKNFTLMVFSPYTFAAN